MNIQLVLQTFLISFTRNENTEKAFEDNKKNFVKDNLCTIYRKYDNQFQL